jgi:hypothetical protein
MARFPVLARSRVRAVFPDPAEQDPVDRRPADSGREDLWGRAEPPGPCQETALFPDTRQPRGTPPPAVSPGRAVTVRPGSRVLTVPRASPARTVCKDLRVRTTRQAGQISSGSRASRVRLTPRDNLVRLTFTGHRVSSDRRASPARTARKGSPARTTRKASLVSSARRASPARTVCKDLRVRMVRKASLVNSVGRDGRPPMTRSGSRGRSEGRASPARPAPARARRCPPATRHRTGSSKAQSATRALAASPAQAAQGAHPVLAAQPARPAGMATTAGAVRRAGSQPADRPRAGTPTTGTRQWMGTARPSTAASTRT